MIKEIYKILSRIKLGNYVNNLDGKSHKKSEIEKELNDFNIKEIDIDKKNVIAYHNMARSLIF